MALAGGVWWGGGLQKPTQAKLTSQVSLSTSVLVDHPFTLKAISIFLTEQRFIQIISSDDYLNNHKNKCVSNSPVKTTDKQTNKQNIHIIEHYPLCTMSVIKTRQNKSVAGHDSSMKMQSSSSGRHSAFFSRGKEEKTSAIIATVNSEKTQTGVFIPFRNNTSRHLHCPRL